MDKDRLSNKDKAIAAGAGVLFGLGIVVPGAAGLGLALGAVGASRVQLQEDERSIKKLGEVIGHVAQEAYDNLNKS